MNRILFATSMVFALIAQSYANNNYFIPGDAFFYFEIERAEWENFKNGETSILKYDRPDHLGFMLCGYAGYLNMDIAEIPAEFRDRLVQAVETMKKNLPVQDRREE